MNLKLTGRSQRNCTKQLMQSMGEQEVQLQVQLTLRKQKIEELKVRFANGYTSDHKQEEQYAFD